MAFKNIKSNTRGAFGGYNVSGKSIDYHSAEETQAALLYSYSVNAYDTSGANPVVTPYPNVQTGYTTTFSTAGYYVLTVSPTSYPITFDMWAWGGGGRNGGSPGPGGGGAGAGVRGRYMVNSGSSLTVLVAAGSSTTTNGTSTFPDGGICNSTYFSGAGGGSSRIGDGTIPFPTRNNAPTQYLLIGGGGGGGSNYLDTGTVNGQAGYPSGEPGGAYYPSDGAIFGGGGTQSAGGAGGSAGREPAGSPGIKYGGGASGTNGGGAGGGGYYGGGGAGGYYANGGGGSSYINPVLSNTADFDASPGEPTSGIAVDDPANPGIKPSSAGNRGNGGAVIFKIVR
jgi:hypothetical protein